MNASKQILIDERALADHRWVVLACELARHVQQFGWINNRKMEVLQNKLTEAFDKCQYLYKCVG